ncbi:MAG: alkaline phosphatase family protein, partial [Candidatus Helarchaeota archaeon]
LYSRIMQHGVKYKLARTILNSETQSGHVSMLTGSFPSHSGIPGNGMYFPVAWDDPSTPENPDYPAGTSIGTFTDPRLIMSETIYQQFAGNASIKTAFIAGKNRLPGFVSVNANLSFGITINGTIMIPPGYDSKVGIPAATIAGDLMDGWPMTCLTQLMINDPDTDFTFINLAFLDDLQHMVGGYNERVYEFLRELDNRMLELFNVMESRGIYDSTLFVITADHGSETVEFVVCLQDILDNSVSPHISGVAFSEGQSARIFLDNPSQLADAVALFEADERVGLIIPWNNTGLPRYGNFSDYNLYPYTNRSGDLLVTLKAGGATILDPNMPFQLLGMHGGPSTVDIPMAFFCKNLEFDPGLTGREILEINPSVVDIMPTIESLMNWSLDTMTLDGQALDILA